jgi:hypothetical protein
MTTLAIMATYEKKRLKCYGTVAAGEHVAVTITDGAQWIGEGKALRLRVLFGPDTVGVFPFADGDAWTATGTQNADAACELNLNTLQAEKYLKHGGTCLWILDDVENHTLYATGEFDVLPWPKRRGIDEPIDLDGYPLLLDEIKDLKEAFEEYQRTVAQMLATKQDTIFDLATIRSGAAAGATAVQPSQIARFVDDAEYKAQYGEQNKPAILFKHGTNVIVALDATPFVMDGMVSDVEIVGGNLVITFNTDSGKQPISIPLTDIFNPDNYYDKTAADGKFVAKADVAATVTQDGANPVKSGGIWSALWGALSALPTGFTSLYDWCVSQLNGKLGNSGEQTLDGTLNIQQIIGAGTPIPMRIEAGRIIMDATSVGESKINIPYKLATTDTFALLSDLNGKADASDLPYAIYKPSMFGDQGGEPCHDRAINSGVCPASSAFVYVPAPIAGKSRDFFIRLDASSRSSDVPVTVEGATLVGPDGTAIATLTAKSHSVTTWRLTEVKNGTTSPSADPVFMVTGANQAPLASPAFTGTPTAPTPTAGDDSTNVATTAFVQGAVPYALVTKTISNNAVTLDDHASNAVTISATLSPNTLTINFPTAATSGKVRDFAMRLNIASGVTAPEIAWPQGVTLENDGGEVPEIADGGTGGSSTILYFSESENNGTTAKFTVKGETLTAIAQA